MSPSRKPRTLSLYDPQVQLDELPSLEERYQRVLAFVARSLPGAIALLMLVTIFEGFTGTLSGISGRAWLNTIGRMPSAIGGQGNLSASAVAALAREGARRAPVRVLISGDSVFAPNLGGGTGNEMSIEDTLSSQITGALNISQEGGEWGTNALLIQKLAQEDWVKQQKPLLVFNVNFKFFGTNNSFSPAFPIETELCAGNWSGPNADLCETLARDWPAALGMVSRVSAPLTRGLLGQFDFFMTFLQRAPIYEANLRGWGFYPLRTFRSGLSDGRQIASDFSKNSPAMHFVYGGREASMSGYLDMIQRSFSDPAHTKHFWLRELGRAVAGWPGPALGVWVSPGPEAQRILSEDLRARLKDMGARVLAVLGSQGKRDLTLVSTDEVLPDPYDYGDSDHPSPQGRRKLAQFVESKVAR